MSPPNMGGQFGDTTHTKVFVGGLAWETQRETMKRYFEQFGEILEAVVITDKNTGRSKGYGFIDPSTWNINKILEVAFLHNIESEPNIVVTFREPEAAMKACVDPSPVIDGRRTNCNLASLGVQRSRPTTPQHGGSRNFRAMKSFHQAGLQGGMGAAAFASAATFPHYAVQQGFPYSVYGYSPYSPDCTYPTSYYNLYGGAAAAQFPVYGGGANAMVSTGATAFYPYFHFGQNGGVGAAPYAQGQTYGGMQYPQMFQYSGMTSTAGVTGFAAQHHGGPMSPPAQPAAAGMTVALPAPALPAPATHHYRLIPPHFAASAAREQPLA